MTTKSTLIPDWFDLGKYEIGKDLPLVDWLLNIRIRGVILNSDFSEKSVAESEWLQYQMENVDLIYENGFLGRNQTELEYEMTKSDFGLEELNPGHGLVYPLPLMRAFEIYEMIHSDTQLRDKLARVEYQEIFRDDKFEPLHHGEVALKKWYKEFYQIKSYDELFDDYKLHSPHICVDLHAPDATLVDAFKDWLKFTRKNVDSEGSELPEKVSSKLIGKWVSSAILPYIDLLIYQKIEKVTLPLHVIGNAIFPIGVDFDTTEAVRKTTRLKAETALKQVVGLMTHAIIEDLQKSGNKIN